MRQMQESLRNDSGSMTVELAVLAPVVIVFGLLSIGFGRYEMSRDRVVDAANAAAQAASVSGTPQSAKAAAEAAAAPALQVGSDSCTNMSVTTNVSDFVPGGVVKVSVSCSVSMSDLLVPGLPGTATVTSEAAAPLDPYRVVG